MVNKRPTLLTAAEWAGVLAGHAKMHKMFPEGGVDRLVSSTSSSRPRLGFHPALV